MSNKLKTNLRESFKRILVNFTRFPVNITGGGGFGQWFQWTNGSRQVPICSYGIDPAMAILGVHYFLMEN